MKFQKLQFLQYILSILILSTCQKTKTTDDKTARYFKKNVHTVFFSERDQNKEISENWEKLDSYFPQLWIQTGKSFFDQRGNLEKDSSQLDMLSTLQPLYLVGTWMSNIENPNNNHEALIHFSEKAVTDSIDQFYAYVFGKKDKKVKFIFLDSENFKEEKPWDWLIKQLDGDELVHVICSNLKMNTDYENTLQAILERSEAKHILHFTGTKNDEEIKQSTNEKGNKIVRFSISKASPVDLAILQFHWKENKYEISIQNLEGKKIAYQMISL